MTLICEEAWALYIGPLSFRSVLSVLIRGKFFCMITGLHAILYSSDADKIRAFLRDVLGLKSVDAGHGWLIFAAPPAEFAAHPTEQNEKPHHELYLMCDDLKATIKELSDKGVQCSAITEAQWGLSTSIHLPDGGELGLYQPKHPTALEL
jgi:catechol 2,3-dioxygenase-like lactoylglutathione lyase family enzyme